MHRIRLEVVRKDGVWQVTQDGQEITEAATQANAICLSRVQAEMLVGNGRTVTLKIKRPNGQIRDERTYPRSSDPKRSKG